HYRSQRAGAVHHDSCRGRVGDFDGTNIDFDITRNSRPGCDGERDRSDQLGLAGARHEGGSHRNGNRALSLGILNPAKADRQKTGYKKTANGRQHTLPPKDICEIPSRFGRGKPATNWIRVAAIATILPMGTDADFRWKRVWSTVLRMQKIPTRDTLLC